MTCRKPTLPLLGILIALTCLQACQEPRRGSSPPVVVETDAQGGDINWSDGSPAEFDANAAPPDVETSLDDAGGDDDVAGPGPDADPVEPTCPQGTQRCGETCVNTLLDGEHCGDCNRPCGEAEVCDAGACMALAGEDCRESGCVGFTYCNLASGECLPGCTLDSQCAGDNVSCDIATRACVCDDGHHLCSGVCVDSGSVDTCGGRCTPCGANQRCTGGECVCESGFHLCNGQCVSNDSVESCGSRCTPCPAGPAGTITTCYQQTCGVSLAFRQFSTTGAYGCGVTSANTLRCWGDNQHGRATPPSGTNWVKVVTGSSHACAITSTGSLQCWGNNADGQTSVGSSSYADVALGDEHTCAITTGGFLQCWGRSTYNRTNPPAGSDYVQIVAGDRHSCALKTNHKVDCWGSGGDSQTSVPTTVDFTKLAAGRVHNCGLTTAGGLRCWGSNTFGQRTAPAGTDFVDVSVNGYTSCALRSNGHLECWGDQASYTPTEVLGISELALGGGALCALLDTEEILCWGSDGIYTPEM